MPAAARSHFILRARDLGILAFFFGLCRWSIKCENSVVQIWFRVFWHAKFDTNVLFGIFGSLIENHTFAGGYIQNID
jgi:hypothetical protein